MTSAIIDLQRLALDRGTPVTDLLRRAMAIARKLRLSETAKWVEHELSGYQEDVPGYRTVRGQVRARNPVHGWIPVIIEDDEIAKALCFRPLASPMAELEILATDGEGRLHIPLPDSVSMQIMHGAPFAAPCVVEFPRTALTGIIDSVRTLVLNWALDLEQRGILGEDLVFSDAEKTIAAREPTNVNNFYGTVTNPQIQQSSPGATQALTFSELDMQGVAQVIAALRSAIPDLHMEAEAERELRAEIQTVEAQTQSPRPKATIVRESLLSIRKILEGASASAVGHVLLELAKFF